MKYLVHNDAGEVYFINRRPKRDEFIIVRPKHQDFLDWCRHEKKKSYQGNVLTEFTSLFGEVARFAEDLSTSTKPLQFNLFFKDLTEEKQIEIANGLGFPNKESAILLYKWDLFPLTKIIIERKESANADD